MLLVENAQQARATGAALETFRNSTVEAVVDGISQGIGRVAQQRLRING
jgi:hypothetical protein